MPDLQKNPEPHCVVRVVDWTLQVVEFKSRLAASDWCKAKDWRQGTFIIARIADPRAAPVVMMSAGSWLGKRQGKNRDV
jgi:hypothetical protein